MVTDGHWIVDRGVVQVMSEPLTLPAMTDHVTALLPLTTELPLFSSVNGTLMLPHTDEEEHVYITFSLAVAEGLLTGQVGVVATATGQ